MYKEKTFNHEKEIHVWQLDLESKTELDNNYYNLLSVLSELEVERANKFKYDEHRYKWVQCHHFLKTTLSKYVTESAEEIIFAELSFGKPILANHEQLHFNLSHCRTKALLAITKCGPIGVDVEYVDDSGDLLKLATRFFSAEEQELLNVVNPKEAPESFFKFWTRKEAFIKCLGAGLQIPLHEFSVNLSDENPVITKIAWDPQSISEWTLCDIVVGTENKGALAIKTLGVEVVLQK